MIAGSVARKSEVQNKENAFKGMNLEGLEDDRELRSATGYVQIIAQKI